MDLLRVRLRFKNMFPFTQENSWYLLNKRKFIDVGAFLTDVKEKFCIRADKLRCRIKGFLLPSWEKIGVIRDEDEIVIEKEEDSSLISSIQPLENGHYDVTVGCNNNIDERECARDYVNEGGMPAKKSELPSLMQNESSLGEKTRHKKKRKHDKIEKDDKGIEEQSLEHGKKKKKGKKSKEVDRLNNAKPEKKMKRKVTNENEMLPKLFTLDDKNSCKNRKIKDPCILQLDVTEEQKCKNEASILPDQTKAADGFKGKEQKAASSRSKKKSSQRIDTRSIERTVTCNVGNEVKGIEIDLEKSALHKSKENNNKKVENKVTKSHENSFQVLNRSIQYNRRNSSQLIVKVANGGNHVYFDSDEDGISENDDISKLADTTTWYKSSADAIGDSFIQPATTLETNMPLYPPKETFHKDVINDICKQANNEKPSFNDPKFAKNIAGEGALASNKSENLMGENKKASNNIKNNGDLDGKYNALTPLQGAPRVGDKIAFKILEMSLSYTPEISDYKEALVQGVDNNGIVALLLADQSKGRKTGDGTLTRKFELESDSEHDDDDDDVLEMHWKDLMDPKLLSG